MHQKAHSPEPTPNPAPPRERPPLPCINFLLGVVRALLSYGRHLDDALPARAEHPRFPTLAASFGTHDVCRILAHVQRGILRAMMLQKFLLTRAAQHRDIVPTKPPEPASAEDIEALRIMLRAPVHPGPRQPRRAAIDPDDPRHFSMPTLKELESQVRRRPVGQTLAEICLDLGVSPSFCEGETWNDILQALTHFGAKLAWFFDIPLRRRKFFLKERERRPETWDHDWRDRPKDSIRLLLGRLLGEPESAVIIPI